jgi:DNA repair exonuclease SbcCD ATPase subunit
VSVALSNHPAGWEGVQLALDEIRASHSEFDAFFTEVFDQLESLAGQWSIRQQEFAATLGESRRENTRLQDRLRKLEQQHASLRQQRAGLEAELAAVRDRATKMAEALAEQRRQAAQQQSQWTDEFHEIRGLLEELSTRAIEPLPPPPAVTPEPDAAGRRAAPKSSADPVLDSLLAQFDML